MWLYRKAFIIMVNPMSAPKWNIAEAELRFSEVLKGARSGPQVIESSGQEVAVVLSIEDYRELKLLQEPADQEARLSEFLRFTEELRNEGGVELELPERSPRPSPFASEHDE